MKIIKQGSPANVKKVTPISIACQDCGLEAELDRGEDVTRCPCCGSSNLVSTVPFVDLSRKKLPSERFPDEYYHFNSSGDGDAAILSERETAKMIDDTVEEYKKPTADMPFQAQETHLLRYSKQMKMISTTFS